MRQIEAVREQWRRDIEERYPGDVPTPAYAPHQGEEFLAYLTTSYLAEVEAAFEPTKLLEVGETLKPEHEVVRFSVGVHRMAARTHSGSEKVVNVHPVLAETPAKDAEWAERWALRQIQWYPREDNAANRIAGAHGLIVRVEWGKSPKEPYEIDTEPSGLGLLMLFSPKARQKIIKHWASLGAPLWAYMPDNRIDDSMEHLAAPLATPDMLDASPNKYSSLLIPFMSCSDELMKEWRGQSIFPVAHMEDKLHLVGMGLAKTTETPQDWEALLTRVVRQEEATVIRQLAGSCATGMIMYAGAGTNRVKGGGFNTRAQALQAIRNAGKEPLLWRPYVPHGRLGDYRIDLTPREIEEFGDPEVLNAIRRYFVVIHPDGRAECVGGLTTARKSPKVHGANDALMIIQDPPAQ